MFECAQHNKEYRCAVVCSSFQMSEDSVLCLNLEKICRVCLSEGEGMHSIFTTLPNKRDDIKSEIFYVHEMLAKLSDMQLNDDQYPSQICNECLEMVDICYRLKQQCNKSQLLLQTYLSQIVTQKRERINDHDFSCIPEEVTDYDEECRIDVMENEIGKEKIIDTNNDVRIVLEGGKEFENVNTLLIISENSDKLHGCHICSKSYKSKSSLKVHMRTHTLECPYVCKECGKGFKRYGSLTYHMRGHTGARPYQCNLCEKQYRQSGTLTAHMRVHTGQKPFLCAVCGRGFRQAPDLTYHMRTHTKERPFMCNVCGKTMSMQCHLVQHMRIHTGERPFKCSDCEKTFLSSSSLKRHEIIHTELKPFPCEVCNKAFNRKNTLLVHSKIHTGERAQRYTIRCST